MTPEEHITEAERLIAGQYVNGDVQAYPDLHVILIGIGHALIAWAVEGGGVPHAQPVASDVAQSSPRDSGAGS